MMTIARANRFKKYLRVSECIHIIVMSQLPLNVAVEKQATLLRNEGFSTMEQRLFFIKIEVTHTIMREMMNHHK